MLGPILRGESVALEPARLEDLDVFRRWFADTQITRYLLMRFALSREQEEDWYRRTATSDSCVHWVITLEGQSIGATSIDDINWLHRHAATGTVIGEPSCWGRGYGSEVVRLRTRFAFEDLALERLETESFAENIPMHRALEKAGYRKIGMRRHHLFREGRWHDEYLFELLREEWLAGQ